MTRSFSPKRFSKWKRDCRQTIIKHQSSYRGLLFTGMRIESPRLRYGHESLKTHLFHIAVSDQAAPTITCTKRSPH